MPSANVFLVVDGYCTFAPKHRFSSIVSVLIRQKLNKWCLYQNFMLLFLYFAESHHQDSVVFSQKMNDVINSTVAIRTNESQKPKLTEDPEDRLVLLDSWIKKKTQVIISWPQDSTSSWNLDKYDKPVECDYRPAIMTNIVLVKSSLVNDSYPKARRSLNFQSDKTAEKRPLNNGDTVQVALSSEEIFFPGRQSVHFNPANTMSISRWNVLELSIIHTASRGTGRGHLV
ncbi:hypothetical protein OUZ56_026050 [Daphnia magna]|uniref:Uncharacterized protein n=1 Tax=Daphnia magna TaxID=35525 RepID=A0ABQ9ZLG8_9CRUS|nr:hypothetical protein OUZ56_026050 [Daphnia magna]